MHRTCGDEDGGDPRDERLPEPLVQEVHPVRARSQVNAGRAGTEWHVPERICFGVHYEKVHCNVTLRGLKNANTHLRVAGAPSRLGLRYHRFPWRSRQRALCPP